MTDPFFTTLAAAIAVLAVVALVHENRQYKKTAYYMITKKPLWFMDKGTRGEYLLYDGLRHLEKSGGRFLFNLYLPKGKNETSEIDALLISPKGLFVFESKNYSGWIFGNDAYKHWTQTFPSTRGRSHKSRFYNPVMQNAAHLTHLKRLIGGTFPTWSIIVFSDGCTFKNLTITNRSAYVIKRHEAAAALAGIYERARFNALTEAQVNDIYAMLYPYTQTTYQTRQQHVKNARSYAARD